MAFVQFGEASSDPGTTVDVVLTGVGNGNWLVAVAVVEDNVLTPTISTQAGSTGAWTVRESQDDP